MLRNHSCLSGCEYCNGKLNVTRGLKHFFGFNSYRSYGGEPLQELAAKAAVDGKSLLAVFPTGGGKSITFQVPALIAGESAKGLTVVISPLQSLMKDQVDNLENRGITEAVTINGLLVLHNQTKLNIKEIQQVWRAIKEITKFRTTVSNSALEIARKAGWDENVLEIETRVTTAIAALEDSGYLKRGQNIPRVFVSSILF